MDRLAKIQTYSCVKNQHVSSSIKIIKNHANFIKKSMFDFLLDDRYNYIYLLYIYIYYHFSIFNFNNVRIR